MIDRDKECLDFGQDDDLYDEGPPDFEPMTGSINRQKKKDRIIEKRERSDDFTIFDNRGMPIRKIRKEIAAFDVVSHYFNSLDVNPPEKVADLNSKDGMWGILLSKRLNISVALVASREDKDRVERIIETIGANGTSKTKVEYEDEFSNEETNFDLLILSHSWGQDVNYIHNKIAEVWGMLKLNGKILLISHKNLGARSIIDHFTQPGIKCEIVARGRGGVNLIEITKKMEGDIELMDSSRTITFKFHGKPYEAQTNNRVFSKDRLDDGTRFLLDKVFEFGIDMDGKKIGDLGSGWGAITMILADQFPSSQIVAIENDQDSYELSKKNTQNFSNVEVIRADLTNPSSKDLESLTGSLDYIVMNPPFHINSAERNIFFMNVKKILKKGGEVIFVVERSFADRFEQNAENHFSILDSSNNPRYFVFRCKK